MAKEYLKLIGVPFADVRDKAVLKGTLKRPDFIIEGTFVEVKSYFVKMCNKRQKGYKEIVGAYLGRKTKTGIFLSYGVIISLNGFSSCVQDVAAEDGVTLIGLNDLKTTFISRGRLDLVQKLEKFECQLS